MLGAKSFMAEVDLPLLETICQEVAALDDAGGRQMRDPKPTSSKCSGAAGSVGAYDVTWENNSKMNGNALASSGIEAADRFA